MHADDQGVNLLARNEAGSFAQNLSCVIAGPAALLVARQQGRPAAVGCIETEQDPSRAQVDKPACHACGSANTLATGVEAPTPQEAVGGAGRTEVYRCTACMSTERCRHACPLEMQLQLQDAHTVVV